MQLACVVVCVRVLVGVLGVMIVVLIGRHAVDVVGAVLVAIFVVILCNWRCTDYTTYPVVSYFLFSLLAWWVFFTGVLIKKVAMIHLWSLPMWIMSLASASFTFLKYLLLV